MALLIIDMQAGLFEAENPRFDAPGTIYRINRLIRLFRNHEKRIIFIQHDGSAGDVLEPGSPGWELLPELERRVTDPVIRKRACDAFYKTDLQAMLEQNETKSIVITGCATDFCVDTTLRSAASRDFEVIAVADGHTTADRPHLNASSIIRHHNWMWENLILPDSRVKVMTTQAIETNRLAFTTR